MDFGISTACLYPALIEDTVRYYCENGVQELELFVNSVGEATPAFLEQLQPILRANGTRVVSIHPFTSGLEPLLFFSDYARRFEDGLKLYQRFFDACNRLGASILVFHGDRAESKNSDDRYFERFQKLYRAARESGVCVAQENVSRCRSREPAFLRKMRQQLGEDVRFVLDLKQAQRSGYPVEEYMDAMGEQLCHLHLNDANATQDCLLPGQGTRDFRSLFENLSRRGFAGGGVIEVYRENFSRPEQLLESYGYLAGLQSR